MLLWVDRRTVKYALNHGSHIDESGVHGVTLRDPLCGQPVKAIHDVDDGLFLKLDTLKLHIGNDLFHPHPAKGVGYSRIIARIGREVIGF